MATLKMVLSSCELNITAQEASGTVKYYCDGVSGNTMDILNNAANSVPYGIGDRFNVNPSGGPSLHLGAASVPRVGSPGQNRTVHEMRVVQKIPYFTNNSKKVWVELGLRSPPTMSESAGSSLIQKRNEFYLAGPNEAPNRKQILLTYYVQPGQFGPNNPPSALHLPQTAATCSKSFYAETFSASNTFYFDEIDAGQLQALKHFFTGRVNDGVFLYSIILGLDQKGDDRRWLCTGVQTNTADNGMSYRVTAEWTYNPEYWDPIIVQTDAHGQPVKLTQSTVDSIMKSLSGRGGNVNSGPNGQIPKPIVEDGAGAGRFPIYQAENMQNLLKVIRKEIPPNKIV